MLAHKASTVMQQSVVIDLHSDIHLDVLRQRGRGAKRVLKSPHLTRWREGRIDAVILNTLPRFGLQPYPFVCTPVQNTLLMLDALQQEISESNGLLRKALEPEDIREAHEKGQTAILLGVEGSEAVMDDLAYLRCFHRLGLRAMTLTWHQRNHVADGASERKPGGLSNFGVELVREMNRLGMLIDISHLSPRGLHDVLDVSSQPVMASHSNARAVCDHPRNLSDDQIKAIAGRGGIIGIVFLGRFVAHDNPGLGEVIDHVDHIAGLVGTAHIGIGPDYVGGCDDMIVAARRAAGPDMPLDEQRIAYASGLEHAGRLGGFTEALLSRGYQPQEIDGILGGNFLRMFQKVRDGAAR